MPSTVPPACTIQSFTPFLIASEHSVAPETTSTSMPALCFSTICAQMDLRPSSNCGKKS